MAASLSPSLAERVRPVSLAGEQLLPIDGALAGLLPRAGLVRGTAVSVEGPLAATSLALAVVASATAAGSWLAAVAMPSLGLAAAEGLGVHLERLVVVSTPEPGQWAAVVAALVEGFDMVLAGPPVRARPADARRLLARVRERRSVLVQVGWPVNRWPEEPELTLTARAAEWEGIGEGSGHCRARRVLVEATGRRGADRARRAWLWLPGADGRLAGADEPAPVPAPAAAPVGVTAQLAVGSERPRLNLVPPPPRSARRGRGGRR